MLVKHYSKIILTLIICAYIIKINKHSTQEGVQIVLFPSKDKNDSEGATGLLFMRVYNKWHGEIKRQLRGVGLTLPQFVVLTTVGYFSQSDEEITQVMVATNAGMDVMTVSQILVLLDKKGWVDRKVHSRDTRANVVQLAEEGQKIILAALPIVERIDIEFFGSLKKDEEKFKKMLRSLNSFEYSGDET